MAIAKKAVLLGATGLIGSHLLPLLEEDPFFESIRLAVRRPFTAEHPKTDVALVNFDDTESFRLALEGCDMVFCAIGTTSRKVQGDRKNYRKVDFDIAVKAARFCRENGGFHFILVSAAGAHPGSSSFYLRLKGEIEAAVTAIGLPALSIFRPSLLLGQRKEKRPAERMAQLVLPALSWALPSRHRPIPAREVAAAMVAAAREQKKGVHIYEYKEMKALLNQAL